MIFFYFQFIHFKTIVKPKSDQCVELLRSRRFFRDQDRPYWLMSYFDVICVIRHQMTQMTSNDAYDIKMWHKSIWPILVSKEASWPQQFHLYIWFWLNYFLNRKIQNSKNPKILCIFEVEFQKVKHVRKIMVLGYNKLNTKTNIFCSV